MKRKFWDITLVHNDITKTTSMMERVRDELNGNIKDQSKHVITDSDMIAKLIGIIPSEWGTLKRDLKRQETRFGDYEEARDFDTE